MLLSRRCLRPASLCRSRRPYSCSAGSAAPLRILFCGSDDFSIASLRAVLGEHEKNPELIDAVHVVHRPAKRTGRGLKNIRQVPIEAVAQDLRLPTHEIDSFTGWTPPKPYNLVVAVSFGLFVPPRILNGAEYGGLNVHPSMLPDLYGAAPIHRTLLRGDRKTGISVQTLHPKHFDQGTILAQTPYPGIDIPNPDACTPAQLVDHLGPLGGSMLVQVLRDRAFLPPVKDAGWHSTVGTTTPPRHASKITKEDAHVDFKTWNSDRLVRTQRILGDLWDNSVHAQITGQRGPPKRIIIHSVSVEESPQIQADAPGPWWVDHSRGPLPALATITCDGKAAYIEACTVEGHRKGEGTRFLARALSQSDKN